MTAVAVAGDPDDPTLCLLHGAGLSRVQWQPQLDDLATDYRVVAPDLPGHGGREDERFSLPAAVSVVAAHLDDEGPATVVGLSLGGYVGARYAVEHPDAVEGLVLAGASVEYTGLAGAVSWLHAWVFRLADRIGPLGDRIEAGRRLDPASVPLDPETVRAINESTSLSTYGRCVQQLCFVDVLGPLTELELPVLVLNGEADETNRHFEADLVASLPDGSLTVVGDAGHAVGLERPDAFIGAVREFLEDRVAPARA